MLRFKILASAVPLIVAAVFARGEFSTGSRPCIAIGGASVQIASLPWQAQLQVGFTSDPSTATVRVQLSESAGAADFDPELESQKIAFTQRVGIDHRIGGVALRFLSVDREMLDCRNHPLGLNATDCVADHAPHPGPISWMKHNVAGRSKQSPQYPLLPLLSTARREKVAGR